jgi:hypothetical protein
MKVTPFEKIKVVTLRGKEKMKVCAKQKENKGINT